MKIIKRSGKEVAFDGSKIVAAIEKANAEVAETKRLTEEEIANIEKAVEDNCQNLTRAASVEEIQDMVENGLMESGKFEIARKYITYRYKRAMVRKSNTTDQQIMSLIECNNEEVKQENSNKNPTVNSVQRDYMAGEVSRDITRRFLLPEDVVKAHQEGIIHFHDSDYFAQHMHNCCLVNLDDMLQNGTVISETMIERPKSFSTACNIATQAIAQIASSQYGGQSITLSHLVPFVDVSRQKFRREVKAEFEAAGMEPTGNQINEIAEMRVRKEIERGVQVIQYQVITLMTTNGQAPFITVFMYLDEVPAGQLRDDLAMVIEEMLKQRIVGVKNEKGVYITPAFPKLIYVLDEDNITEGSKYWYLTKLAAKCTAKRMVPDYISAKKMKEYKKGDVYPCMGCR
ncbi:MAG: anaerobic ribonucleoside-triphosphate reductase, partial [Butyrivibrio sp.]|nr:anaerobic ribonucleoside-triphosphate reductase [Butyrivibrio sp.]